MAYSAAPCVDTFMAGQALRDMLNNLYQKKKKRVPWLPRMDDIEVSGEDSAKPLCNREHSRP